MTVLQRLPSNYAETAQMDQLFRLDGRKVVVVGAAGGIGMTVSQGIAAHGAHVVTVDRNSELADAAAAAVTSVGGSAESDVCNILDSASINELAERHPDAASLVIMPAMIVRKKLEDQTEEEIDLQFALNVKAILILARTFAAAMAVRGGGTVVTMSSVRAQVVETGSGMYSATKAGLIMIMKSLALEFGERGVRFNTIAPSPVATPLTEDVRSKQEWVDQTADRTMLKRWAEPADFVGPVVFLASDASGFLTGADIVVDGGWTSTDGLSRVDL